MQVSAIKTSRSFPLLTNIRRESGDSMVVMKAQEKRMLRKIRLRQERFLRKKNNIGILEAN
jgi:hypothetical protein